MDQRVLEIHEDILKTLSNCYVLPRLSAATNTDTARVQLVQRLQTLTAEARERPPKLEAT